MSDHPNAAAFEAFVIGALDEPERAKFVEHVSTCDMCAATLEREAAVELALMDVHEASKKKRSVRPTSTVPLRNDIVPLRRASIVVGAVAIAAALFLFLRSRDPKEATTGPAMTMTVQANAPPETAPIPPVTCLDGMGQEKCIEDAHRHGLFVVYPPWAKSPPLGGAGRGPNGPPFGDEAM